MMFLSGQHFNHGLGLTNFKPILSEVTKLGAKSSNVYHPTSQMQGRSTVTKSRGSKAGAAGVHPQAVVVQANVNSQNVRASSNGLTSLEAQAREGNLVLAQAQGKSTSSFSL